MKRAISIFLIMALMASLFVTNVYGEVGNIDVIDINNINLIAEKFENSSKVIRIDMLGSERFESREIINNDQYYIVGTKSSKKLSISILNKQTKKIDSYEKSMVIGKNTLNNNNTFIKLNTINLANRTTFELYASDTVNTYNCKYLRYKYTERWPAGPASDINVKFTLTKPSQSCMTSYVVKTSDIYKYSKQFETHIRYADNYMENGYIAGMGFVPGAGEAMAIIEIVETANNPTVENMISLLITASGFIPFWGDIISLADMASKFVMASGNCVLANSDFQKVYNLCN